MTTYKLQKVYILNNYYRKFLNLKNNNYKDADKYIRKLKKIYNNINNFYNVLELSQNFLIFILYRS